MRPRRALTIAGLVLLAALTLIAGRAQAAADPNVAHIDGYLSTSAQQSYGARTCLLLSQHDGKVLALGGHIRGLQPNDHVRLEGRFDNNSPCGVGGFIVTKVQTLWADDNHRSTYYDHLQDGSFYSWAVSNDRVRPRR
ncbi:MAG: hypothetical protein M3O15_13455 [Acidobacteriota bacterium]|nr:hypothetical protein [Acidobacteriota bacterium]